MSDELRRFLRNTLFLQRVHDLTAFPGAIRELYQTYDGVGVPDVSFMFETLKFAPEETVVDFFRSSEAPRFVVCEKLETRGVMWYTKAAADGGFRLYACRFIDDDQGDQFALMDFHRKERTNAPAPQ